MATKADPLKSCWCGLLKGMRRRGVSSWVLTPSGALPWQHYVLLSFLPNVLAVGPLLAVGCFHGGISLLPTADPRLAICAFILPIFAPARVPGRWGREMRQTTHVGYLEVAGLSGSTAQWTGSLTACMKQNPTCSHLFHRNCHQPHCLLNCDHSWGLGGAAASRGIINIQHLPG